MPASKAKVAFGSDLVFLEAILRSMEGAHVADEGARDGGC
jgi:hypothetical protein